MRKFLKLIFGLALSCGMITAAYGQAPVNDNCADATPVGEVQLLEFSTFGASFDGPGVCLTSPNIWYLYTATITGRIEAHTLVDGYNDTLDFDSKLAVYEGVDCFATSHPPTPVRYLGGESIETAAVISGALPAAYVGTTVGYQHDYDLSCNYYNINPDVVYSYTAPDDGLIFVSLCPWEYEEYADTLELYSPTLGIFDSDGNELVTANDSRYCFQYPGIFNYPVVQGQTYYIVISGGWTNDSGDYILTFDDTDFNLLDCCGDYYWDQGRVAFDAVAGEQYLIELGSSEGTIGSGNLTIEPVHAPPPNDDCENATDGGVLQPGSLNGIQFTGDNSGATTDCIFFEEAEAWIKFTTEECMNITLDYCGSEFDFAGYYFVLTNGCPCGEMTQTWPTSYYCPNDDYEYSHRFIWDDVPAGEYWYPILTYYENEGPYTINVAGVRCNEAQYCDVDYIYGQEPASSNELIDFLVSEASTDYAMADDFSGLTDRIGGITWWGVTGNGEPNWFVCNPDSIDFQIIFCNNISGAPGDTVASYEARLSYEENGFRIGYCLWQRMFHYDLPTPVDLTDGWVIIRSDDESCQLRWQNALSNGQSRQYDEGLSRWLTVYSDMAFCLYPDTMTAIDDDELINTPMKFKLSGNYPNPFNASTSIQFSTKNPGDVTLDIYDVTGRLIKTLYNGKLEAGSHSFIWDGTSESGSTVSSGVYFYRLKSAEGSQSKRMILLK